MTLTLSIFFLIAAVIVFAIATWWSPPRGNLISLGLLLLSLSFLFSEIKIAQ